MIKGQARKDFTEWCQDNFEVGSALGELHRLSKFPSGHIEKFLNDLSAYDAPVILQRPTNPLFGDLLFSMIRTVKAIDKEIRIEKISIVHSILRGKICDRRRYVSFGTSAPDTDRKQLRCPHNVSTIPEKPCLRFFFRDEREFVPGRSTALLRSK